MPAYNFKMPFSSYVADGTKPHTIRSRRKYPAVESSPLFLYKGLRTVSCQLLRSTVCLHSSSLVIHSSGITVYSGMVFDPKECLLQKHSNPHVVTGYYKTQVRGTVLEKDVCNRLAWLDGFRPEHSSLDCPGHSFEMMKRFFGLQYGLPFCGDIIFWDTSNGTYC